MTDLSWILRQMLFSTNEQAYIPFLYEVVMSWLCKCTQSRSVNPNISGDSHAPCIWRAVFLCSCSVMNCADSDHLCSWFSGLRFVYQIMSQWFIIVIRVVIKSSPNESFSLFSQASHKSLNLRLESDSSQVMWLESPTSGRKRTMHGERQVCWGSDRSSFLSVIR